jgi:phosphoglycerate kinase
MVFTFAKAMGYRIGDSLLEDDKVTLAGEIIAKVKESKARLLFPTDAVVASDISDDARTETVPIDSIPDGMKGLDIGPDSLKLFSEALEGAKTVVWNGPMGVFESRPFATGTFGIARLLAELTGRGAVTIVGGGDSAAAVSQAGLEEQLTHISTGGGASLEFLEGKLLPGVEALTDVARGDGT